MKKYDLKKVLLMLFVFCGVAVFSQNQYWEKSSPSKFTEIETLQRVSIPNAFKVFHLDMDKFKEVIATAPLMNSGITHSSVVIEFPNSDGAFQRFSITESSIMHPLLAAKYPEIKTYKAIGIDDPTATMRFSITQFGLHTMKLSGVKGAAYIDPYTIDRENYIIYDKASLDADYGNFECLTDMDVNLTSLGNNESDRADGNDQKLRTYRLALSTAGEYSALFSGSGTKAMQKTNVLAQMVVTMNRVNEVYERDLAITMQLVPDTNKIIYLSPSSDPWDNEYNSTTQSVLDDVIGDANYDIGHNFNTSGGGNAGCIGCVCQTGQKGSAFTGLPNPTGDPFDIDFVAHEIGHQFGGFHTMNTCSRSGSGATEVEPASGSSIMGYAGICPTNVQNNSDAHFNYVNVRDIQDNVQTGTSSACAQETTLTNQPPVANAGSDYTIPISTPFVLKGSASDPDGLSTLTYNWSQNDPENAGGGTGSPQSTWAVGPLYRSRFPSTSLNRWMPQISNVISNDLTPTWEVTPSVSRQMSFSFIVRDNGSGFANGIGQTSTDLMDISVEDSDPFVILTPNTDVIWNVGSTEMISWDVGQTDNTTINCQTVNIKLSTDGGMTYPILLSSNTPNDGSEAIMIPNILTTSARVMVEAADNIFYDISDANFSIDSSLDLTKRSIDSFEVVPNPSNGQFDIKLTDGFATELSVSVFDLHGRVIYKKLFTNASRSLVPVELNNVSNGLYFLNVSDGIRRTVKRILVK